MQLPSRLGVRHLAAEIGSRPATFLEGEVTTAGRKPLTPPVRTCLSRLRRLMCGDFLPLHCSRQTRRELSES